MLYIHKEKFSGIFGFNLQREGELLILVGEKGLRVGKEGRNQRHLSEVVVLRLVHLNVLDHRRKLPELVKIDKLASLLEVRLAVLHHCQITQVKSDPWNARRVNFQKLAPEVLKIRLWRDQHLQLSKDGHRGLWYLNPALLEPVNAGRL